MTNDANPSEEHPQEIEEDLGDADEGIRLRGISRWRALLSDVVEANAKPRRKPTTTATASRCPACHVG